MNGYNYGVPLNEIKKEEKREIRFLSIMAATAVICYLLFSQAVTVLISALGLGKIIRGSILAYESASLLLNFVTLFLAFLIAWLFERKRTDIDILPFDKPASPLITALAIPAGAAVCIIGSVVTNFITAMFSETGITLSQPDISSPSSGYALVIYVLRLTLVPALVEEMCFRGILMQPLRKYGNLFAVVMSAMVFALTHGNLIQAPAAFISGLGIGYFTIATGTLWTGVGIHLLNNLTVAVTQYFYAQGETDFAIWFSSFSAYIIVIAGVVCLVLFFIKRKTPRIDNINKSLLTAGEKVSAYIFNPAMIAMIIAIAFIMKEFIST